MADLTDRKRALIRDLDRTRAELSAHGTGALAHAHPGEKVRAAFVKNRVAWIGGAALLGLILAKIPARRKKVVISTKRPKEVAAAKSSAGLAALKFAFDISRPWLTAWATKRVAAYAAERASRGSRRF